MWKELGASLWVGPLSSEDQSSPGQEADAGTMPAALPHSPQIATNQL